MQEVQHNLQQLEACTHKATPCFNFKDLDKMGMKKDFLYLTQRIGNTYLESPRLVAEFLSFIKVIEGSGHVQHLLF
jgi:hypothetical protein